MNSLNIVMLDSEFRLFQKMIYDTAGINMTEAKKSLISSRLAKRVRELGLASYAEYFDIVKNVSNGDDENKILVTSHEFHHSMGGRYNCVPGMGSNAHYTNQKVEAQLNRS